MQEALHSHKKGYYAMSTEQNKSTVRRWVEGGWNQGNLALVDELFAADYMVHDTQVPDFPGGQAAFKQFFTNLRSPFPDIHVTIEGMTAEGNKVAWRWRITGTHTGDLMGIPPTGKLVNMTGIVISHFVDGTWAEDYVN